MSRLDALQPCRFLQIQSNTLYTFICARYYFICSLGTVFVNSSQLYIKRTTRTTLYRAIFFILTFMIRYLEKYCNFFENVFFSKTSSYATNTFSGYYRFSPFLLYQGTQPKIKWLSGPAPLNLLQRRVILLLQTPNIIIYYYFSVCILNI